MKIKNKLGNLARLGNLASRDVHLLLVRFPNLATLPFEPKIDFL